jgi:hypothetical protein
VEELGGDEFIGVNPVKDFGFFVVEEKVGHAGNYKGKSGLRETSS